MLIRQQFIRTLYIGNCRYSIMTLKRLKKKIEDMSRCTYVEKRENKLP